MFKRNGCHLSFLRRNKTFIFYSISFWIIRLVFSFVPWPRLCDLKTQRDQLLGNIIAPLLVIILQLIITWNSTQPYIESNHHKWNYSFAARSSFSSICGIVSCLGRSSENPVDTWSQWHEHKNSPLSYELTGCKFKTCHACIMSRFLLHVIEFIDIFW